MQTNIKDTPNESANDNNCYSVNWQAHFLFLMFEMRA
jgi:hypothetical protein